MRRGLGRITVLLVTALALLGLPAVASAAAEPGFVPSSTSWTSARSGWVLGFVPCGQDQCARLLRTLDGGHSWLTVSAPPVKPTPEHDQVRVHFANGLDGLITDGHRLFASHSGGAVWRQIGLPPDVLIGALASNDRFSYAIVSGAEKTTLYSSPVGVTRWAPVPGVSLPGARGGGSVVARGTSAFVALDQIFESSGYWSTADGRDWLAGTPPCAVDAVPELGLARDRALFALCSYDPGRGFMAKDLYRAAADGTFGYVSTAPPVGISTGFDAASASTVAIAAVGDGAAFIHRGATSWDTPLIAEESPVYDLAFTDARHGTAVLGGPGWAAAIVYRTTDGGGTWTPLTL